MTTIINNENKKLNVPNLRFPEFQEEWEKCTLGNNVKIQGGYAFKSELFLRKGIPIIRISNLPQNASFVDLDDCTYYKEGNYNSFEVHNGDLLIAMSGATTGKTAIYNKKTLAYLNQRVGLFKSTNSDRLYYPFLYAFVSTPVFKRQLSTRLIAGAQPNISSSDIESIRISIPQKTSEQEKIAHLMLLLDKRIATQNKIIDKLQSLIKGLNDFLYTQYGGEVLTSFAELGTSYSGLSGKSAQDFGSGKPFITYLNVYSNNVIKENDFQYVAIKDDEKQNVVKYGDVLFTLSSETPEEVGVGSVYLGKEKVYLNSFCFGIHITNTEVAFPPYLSYYVSLTAFRKFIYPYAQGSTRFNLCKADFEKASIKLPTLADQKRIYSILSHIDNKIITERQMLDLYNSQKQYLLRQMFI